MMTYSLKNSLFPLGRLLVAPELETLGIDTPRLLRRHQSGDFGCVDQYDIDQNLKAINANGDILSQYHIMAADRKNYDLRHDRSGSLLHRRFYS